MSAILITNKKHELYRFLCKLKGQEAQFFEFSSYVEESDYRKIDELKKEIPFGYYCETKEKRCPYYDKENKCRCTLLDTNQDENFCLINKVKVCRVNEE